MSRAETELFVRLATIDDVPAMAGIRERDVEAGPADPRMAAYLAGRHHPQLAVPPRVAYFAEVNEEPAGYIAGHLTRRFGCDGEVQYLYVARAYRRVGAASALLKTLAEWFVQQKARRICVNVNADSPGADPFYIRHGAEPLQPYWRVWPDIGSLLS